MLPGRLGPSVPNEAARSHGSLRSPLGHATFVGYFCGDPSQFCTLHPVISADRTAVEDLQDALGDAWDVSIEQTDYGYATVATDLSCDCGWISRFSKNNTLLTVAGFERETGGEMVTSGVFDATDQTAD